MRRLIKQLEDIMVAITFAEVGEYDESLKDYIDSEQQETSTSSKTPNTFVSATAGQNVTK